VIRKAPCRVIITAPANPIPTRAAVQMSDGELANAPAPDREEIAEPPGVGPGSAREDGTVSEPVTTSDRTGAGVGGKAASDH
jgi:hypothetical protein